MALDKPECKYDYRHSLLLITFLLYYQLGLSHPSDLWQLLIAGLDAYATLYNHYECKRPINASIRIIQRVRECLAGHHTLNNIRMWGEANAARFPTAIAASVLEVPSLD